MVHITDKHNQTKRIDFTKSKLFSNGTSRGIYNLISVLKIQHARNGAKNIPMVWGKVF